MILAKISNLIQVTEDLCQFWGDRNLPRLLGFGINRSKRDHPSPQIDPTSRQFDDFAVALAKVVLTCPQ